MEKSCVLKFWFEQYCNEGHPVRNRVAIKVNFTVKAMAELKSLRKRLQE